MKHLRLLPLILTLCLLFTGCIPISNLDTGKDEAVFEIPYYGLELTADSRFSDVSEDSPFDLQITDGNSYLSIFAFEYIDLAEGQDPLGIYDLQNEQIFSLRENVSVIEDISEEVLDGKTITKALYSAELDGSKNYYSTYLVDFEDDEVFAWVLITSLPSYWEKHSEEFESIVYSLKPSDIS